MGVDLPTRECQLSYFWIPDLHTCQIRNLQLFFEKLYVFQRSLLCSRLGTGADACAGPAESMVKNRQFSAGKKPAGAGSKPAL